MTTWVIIIGMGVVTFGTRWMPFTFLREDMLPTWARRGLTYVPLAVLSAIIGPEYIPHETWGHFTVDAHLVAGLIAIAVAWYTKNTILTILAGMIIILI